MSMSAAAIGALLNLVALQQQIQAPPITPAPSFQAYQSPGVATLFASVPAIAEPARLELTPEMRGVIANEEWDVFSNAGGVKTYLQWAPGSIYVAGTAPIGTDLVLSLDLGNDGWLVGSNNYEARVKMDPSGNPTVSIRRLNAANVAGPTWEDLPGWVLSSVCKATSNGSTVDYELQLNDAGLGVLPRKPQMIAARLDLVNSNEPPIAPTQTRILGSVTLVTSRAEGLPADMRYSLKNAEKPVIPGQSKEIGFEVSTKTKGGTTASPSIKRINISAEGATRAKVGEMNAPFPLFDKAGRASVDYVTKVALDTVPGYHVLKAALTLGDDTPATVETSFLVAEPVSVEILKPLIPISTQDRSVSVAFDVSSHLAQPVQGTISFTMDPSFKVLNRSNNTLKFTLEQNGRTSDRFEIFIPANSSGTYPVTFDVSAGALHRKFTRFFTIGQEPKSQKKKKRWF